MLPKATVHFDGPRDEPYTGKVIVRHSWVYLADEGEMYPSDKVTKIEFDEMYSPLQKLKKMFDLD